MLAGTAGGATGAARLALMPHQGKHVRSGTRLLVASAFVVDSSLSSENARDNRGKYGVKEKSFTCDGRHGARPPNTRNNARSHTRSLAHAHNTQERHRIPPQPPARDATPRPATTAAAARNTLFRHAPVTPSYHTSTASVNAPPTPLTGCRGVSCAQRPPGGECAPTARF